MTMVTRRAFLSAGGPSGTPPSKTSIALADATSPACAPPIPSAMTNSGEREK